MAEKPNKTAEQLLAAAGNDERRMQEMLEKLAAMFNSSEGHQPSAEPKPKPMEEYKFWKTQPVMKFGEPEPASDVSREIETKTVDDVAAQPRKLPAGFEWVTVDVTSETELSEIYQLLYDHYVEDVDEQFRFRYSVEFLAWYLRPPGYNKTWSVGVRASESKRLVGFISGVPATLDVRGKELKIAEINFMCVHKKLRSRRLAPILIAEVTRRINLCGVWQALYTSGTTLPKPVGTAQYYHRSLDWQALAEVGFVQLPPNSTVEAQIQKYQLPAVPKIAGFRKMVKEDVPQVFKLLTTYLAKFLLSQKFTEAEMEHWLFGPEKVVFAYVVEDSNGTITDMVSFYGLESTVIGNDQRDRLAIAYAYYYATSDPSRLVQLFEAALIMARDAGFHCFNALTVMDNPVFLDELLFGMGDGSLHYYLFNYQTAPIAGGCEKTGKASQPGGIGALLM